MNKLRLTLFASVVALSLLSATALPKDSLLTDWMHSVGGGHAVPAGGTLEVAFSPKAGATELVVKAIASAKKSIRLAAYSFTSKPIAQALVDAHKRGVDVQVVVDKSQKSERYTSATFLANIGIPVRVDSMHAIQHNKFMVIDGAHVETGSFNYTSAAEQRNAENVMVIWNNPRLATTYADNWLVHWEHSEPYAARY
jgi:phosphatidylserine/phosphatidylglycerophosphate/cardiolipin synthase-like enzyme